MLIFALSKKYPTEERYSLTDQVRRAWRSVASNTAEAWRKWRCPAAFVAKLSVAETVAAETQTWVEIARRSCYLKPQVADNLDRRGEEILGQLVRMAEHPEDWMIRDHTPRA